MSEASRHSCYHQSMTIVILLFIGAISLMLGGVYRASYISGRVDVVTGAAFGLNLGLVWGIGLFGIGLMEWGTDALPLLIVGALFLTVIATMLGAVPALIKRKREWRERPGTLSS